MYTMLHGLIMLYCFFQCIVVTTEMIIFYNKLFLDCKNCMVQCKNVIIDPRLNRYKYWPIDHEDNYMRITNCKVLENARNMIEYDD